MRRRAPVVVLLLCLAAAAIFTSQTNALTLTNHLTIPHGVTRTSENHLVVVSLVPPPNADDDDVRNALDRCPHSTGWLPNGCEPRPKPSPAVETSSEVAATAPAPSPSSVAPATGGSSSSLVDPSCESGGDPTIYDSTGTYWGKYQFDQQTWDAYAPSGSWGSASEAEQDAAAAAVPYDAWPNC